jgi:hypothetical protein
MESADIKFNSKLRMPFKIDQQSESVLLEISDSLEASEQQLQPSYRQKIADFLNSSESWYPLAIKEIRNKDGDPGRIRLLQVFILSEQDADSLVFGLMFRVDIDVEHGRGLKVEGQTLRVLDYGIGDVAFS